MKKMIVATDNVYKKAKLRWLLADFPYLLVELSETIEIEESGKTFEENARIKAQAVALYFHSYAIASDGGALIPALGAKWDALLTRRFLGKKDVTDFDRIEGLLSLMENIQGDGRKLVWHEAIAIADPLGKIVFSTEVEGDTGLIQTSYKKDQYRKGIWLCTLWSYPQFGGRNFFELDENEAKEGELSWWRLKEKVSRFFQKADF